MSSKDKGKGIQRPPHDRVFKKMMEDIVVAQEFLEHNLPEEFRQLVDLSKIRVEKESYIELSLKSSYDDIVYSIQTKDNEEAFVYVLLEHQSSSDYWLAFRLWKYMLLLCERHKKNKDKLPLVVPLVLYNGSTKYTAPRNLWDLFTLPEQAKKLMAGDYRLVDLNAMADDEIKRNQHLGMLQYFMKHIRERDMLKLWERFLQEFKEAILIDRERGYVYIKYFLQYTDTKVPVERQQELSQLIVQHLSEEHGEEIMQTIAQHYIDQGKLEGIQIGEARGKAERDKEIAKIAKGMLKEGVEVSTVSRLTGLSLEQLKSLI